MTKKRSDKPKISKSSLDEYQELKQLGEKKSFGKNIGKVVFYFLIISSLIGLLFFFNTFNDIISIIFLIASVLFYKYAKDFMN